MPHTKNKGGLSFCYELGCPAPKYSFKRFFEYECQLIWKKNPLVTRREVSTFRNTESFWTFYLNISNHCNFSRVFSRFVSRVFSFSLTLAPDDAISRGTQVLVPNQKCHIFASKFWNVSLKFYLIVKFVGEVAKMPQPLKQLDQRYEVVCANIKDSLSTTMQCARL